MRFLPSVLLFGLLVLTSAALPVESATHRRAGALVADILHGQSERVSFDFPGTVTYICTNQTVSALNLGATDGTNSVLFRVAHTVRLPDELDVGLCARFQGHVETDSYGRRFAVLDACEGLGTTETVHAVSRTIAELTDSDDYFRLCRLVGTLTDVSYASEDRQWIICEITDGNDFIFVSLPAFSDDDLTRLTTLVGSRIAVTGLCVPYDHGPRIVTGKLFKAASANSISELEKPRQNLQPEFLPSVSDIRDIRPQTLATLGRHRARGHVLATWAESQALIRQSSGDIVGIEFAPGGHLPGTGDFIEASGLPETDLFRINLYNATWRMLPQTPQAPDIPTPLHISRLIQTSARGFQHFTCSRYHGQTVTLEGLVRGTPQTDPNPKMYVESEGTLIPVDASTHPNALTGVTVGCKVRITGICVLDVDSPQRANSLVYRTRALRVVLRGADDVTVLSRPSWWTSERLLGVIGTLFVALICIFIWNRSLRHLVERRSRELLRSQVETMSTELRVEERTRLAVELHDSLSQNLTGISFQVDMAERLTGPEQRELSSHLTIAARMLHSCRDELRNCIYDLRNQAFDLKNLEEAIRVTLHPHLENARLSLRFNVSRARLTDKTTHAILRIIRELVTNAVRHGQATQVAVAGALENDRLLFSVKDNGCGFDPENSPGLADGHFGLQGIKERIRQYKGTMKVDSASGQGTRIAITLLLQPQATARRIDRG